MAFDYRKQKQGPGRGDQIWFATQDDEGITIKAGRLIGYKDEDYLVESSDKDDADELVLKEDEIFKSLKGCLKKYNLIKYCEIYLGSEVKVRDYAIANDIEAAIDILKKKYPEATFIREVE